MKTFTVHCEYPLLYRAEVTVEAEDPVSACRAAILSANETDAWKALDWEQRTYVSALAEAPAPIPGDFSPMVLMPPSCRFRACFRMCRCSRAMPRHGARIWSCSSAS